MNSLNESETAFVTLILHVYFRKIISHEFIKHTSLTFGKTIDRMSNRLGHDLDDELPGDSSVPKSCVYATLRSRSSSGLKSQGSNELRQSS